MKSKALIILVILLTVFSFSMPTSFAAGGKEAVSSFLLPTTGQAMNGQMSDTKTKIMAGVEVASVATVAILGGVVGGPIIWAGLGPLIANHVWSATDAYRNAQYKNQAVAPAPQNQYNQTSYQPTISQRIAQIAQENNVQ